jgi:hypothetical protein
MTINTGHEEKGEVYTNNAHIFEFQESLPEPHEHITTHQIDVILDTGATFSMLPGHFEFAWIDLKPCLHTIEGYLREWAQINKHKWVNFTHS